jgi:hypothetical protein
MVYIIYIQQLEELNLGISGAHGLRALWPSVSSARPHSRYDVRTVTESAGSTEGIASSQPLPYPALVSSRQASPMPVASGLVASESVSSGLFADELVADEAVAPTPVSRGLVKEEAAGESIDSMEGWPRLCVFGLQHVLVMYAGTVAVPLILGSALHLSPGQMVALISADLFTSAGDAAADHRLGQVRRAASSDPGLLIHLRGADDP